jgi:ATP-dependent Clp protease ATP-binding subunit ClpA
MSTLTSNLDEICRQALDLAKRALPEGQRLDVSTLLDALFFSAELGKQDLLAPLVPYFHEPTPLRDKSSPVRVDEGLKEVFQSLASVARVTPQVLFVTLMRSETGQLALQERGLSPEEWTNIEPSLLVFAALDMAGIEFDQTEPASAAEQPAGEEDTLVPGEGANVTQPRRAARRKKIKADLGDFGILLTDPDRPLRMPRVLPDRPLATLLRHLLTPRSRNILLIGPPGVGKTSLLHALAQKLMTGGADLPVPLHDLELFELSPNFPRTGPASFGDFNPAQELQKVRTFLRTLEDNPDVVLVVDRFFAFLGMLHRISLHQELFDGFIHSLDTGAITCIGCLAPEEQARLGELDASLFRRFRILHLPPPMGEDLLAILEARRRKLEEHFGPLQVPADLLAQAVKLSDEHLRDRHQPEKSIRLLESACARASTEQPPAPVLTEKHLLQGVEDFVGSVVVSGPTITVEELTDGLQRHIVGQDGILARLAQAVVAGRADNAWFLRPGPRGVFLFGGPTGVGKTETALHLSRLLGGGRDALVRVDCQNLQGSGSGWEANTLTWRLLGVAPGYRGHTPGCRDGLLVRVRDFPECVLLFDEFEKADATVGRLMLRILDEGKCQDSEGHELDFRRCFVILTTNAGVTYHDPDRGRIVFAPPEASATLPQASTGDLQRDLLSTGLGQEFLGRVQHVFLFNGLHREHIRAVLERQLEELKKVAQVRGKELSWSPAVVDHLARIWEEQKNLGARYLTSLVRSHIIEQLNIAASLGELPPEVARICIDAPASSNSVPGHSTRRRHADELRIELS